MHRETANGICAQLQGAVLEHPFGDQTDTWKVGGKIFALMSSGGISLKARDAEAAQLLMDIGLAQPAPYLKRGGWMQIPWEVLEKAELTKDDLAHHLTVSYETIVAKLPKKLRP